MSSNTRHEAGAVNHHQEQRLHKRKTVNLAGLCIFSDGKKAECKILDFCVGGMFLEYHRSASIADSTGRLPNIEEVIQIQMKLPTASGSKKIFFNAKIIRIDKNSAGIAFIDPDLDTLQTVIKYINNQNTNIEDDQAENHQNVIENSLSKYETLKVIDSCKDLTKNFCQQLAHEFLEKVSDYFMSIATTAKNNNEQNSYFEAINMFDAASKTLPNEIIEGIATQLSELGHEKLTTRADLNISANNNKLSLMEDNTLENWLAIKDIINFSLSNNAELNHEVERKLTTLFQEQVEDNNNPFSPFIITQAFEAAIDSNDLDHNIKLSSLSVFKNLLSANISELYTQIITLLNDNKIETSPDIKIQTPESDETPTLERTRQINEEQQLQSKLDLPTVDTVHTPNEETLTQVQTQTQTQNSPPEQQNIFQLTQELLSIQSQLPKKTNGSHSANNNRNSEDLYSAKDVLSALSSLKNSHSENKRSDIKSQVLEYLSQQQESGNTKYLDSREHEIIDITDTVFNSLSKDMLVANNVRSWINQLEIPLLKIALNDDTLYSDKSHSSRKVINQISQLELYEATENNTPQSAIRTKIDKLLERINNEVDDNPIVFDQALKELDMIINIQNSAYAENLQEVVASCEKQNYSQHPRTFSTSEVESIPEEKLNRWIARIHRLKIDSWLLVSENNATPYRVRLGWISKDKTHYVFVNLKGQKDITLTDSDLAIKLINDDAVILDHADEPALDRAQQSMLQNLHDQLIHESTHDPLTGRINRRDFERYLRDALANIKDESENHTLCHIDINQFSLINNTCGFEGGDALLNVISNKIETALNDNATIGRIGSDQFGVLIKNTSLEETKVLWQSLLNSFEEYRFNWEEKSLSISISIGIATFEQSTTNITLLMQTTETCCQNAKNKGNNQIQSHQADDAVSSQRQRLMDWVVHIDKVIDNNLLALRYQPIASIKSNNSSAAHHSEILLKIMDEQGNTVSPQDFVLAAEQYNRMPAIDRWVIEHTFSWISKNKHRMNDIGGFAINLSGKTLNDKTTLPFVLKLLDNPDIKPEWICFEVTETAGIDNLSDATEFIEKVKETGVKFSLDDFGSGLSSYAYLKNLPVDYLKIDGAFIKEIDKNPNDYAVVKSICEIGHFMGKEIIAEFVENDSILAQLKEIGIDYAQGYGIQKPRDLEGL